MVANANNKDFIQTLSDILIKHRVFSPTQAGGLQRAFHSSPHEDYEHFLLEEGLVTKDEMLEALSKYYTVPFFDVSDYFFKTLLLHEFPKEFLIRNAIIPVDIENQSMLTMVAANPNYEGLESEIRNFVSYDIIFFVGIKSDIWDAVEEYYDTAVTQVQEDVDRNQEERELQEADRIMLEDTDEIKAENEAEDAGQDVPPGEGIDEGEG